MTHGAIIGVISAYVVLAAWYGVLAPLNEPYDERYHFAYVLSVALDHGLPVQDIEHPGAWGNEGSQPPLYYLIAGAVSAWTAESDTSALTQRNPYTVRHEPAFEFNDNRNIYIHRRSQGFPYAGNTLAMHIARLVSALGGALAICGTYAAVLIVAPARRELAAGAAAFHAFIPSFVYVGGAVSNDALAIGLASATFAAILAAARAPAISRRRASILGALAGLAALTKLSTLPLIGVALLVCVPRVRAGRWAEAAQIAAAMVGAFLAVSGWWLARNLALYGELLGTGTMNRIAGLRSVPAGWAQMLAEMPQVERTFWAAFGTGNIHPDPVYLLAPRLLVIVGAAGCVLALWRQRNVPRSTAGRSTVLALFAAWCGVLAVLLLWWLHTVTSVTGRLLYPLLTPISIIVIYGVAAFGDSRWRRVAALVPGIIMLALALVLPVAVLIPAYAGPPSVTETGEAASPVNVEYGGLFQLRAATLREREARMGRPLHVDLYEEAISTPGQDYTVVARLLMADGTVLGGRDTLPGRGNFPATDWVPHIMYRDTVPLYVEQPITEPVAAAVSIGWYQTQSAQGLPALNSEGTRPGRVIVGRVRVVPERDPPYKPTRADGTLFAGVIELVGYDHGPDGITLFWRAPQLVSDDYTVFVQAHDASGNVIAQSDAQPRAGNYPTSFWRPGEVVRDPHMLAIPAGASRIIAGLYLLGSGERARTATGADHVELAP